MFKNVEYTKLKMLEEIWQRFDRPIIINFYYKDSPLSLRSTEFLFELHKRLAQFRLMFLMVEVTDVERFIDEYQFGRFPAIMLYDYNKEICRFSSWDDINNQLELKCKELCSVEK